MKSLAQRRCESTVEELWANSENCAARCAIIYTDEKSEFQLGGKSGQQIDWCKSDLTIKTLISKYVR